MRKYACRPRLFEVLGVESVVLTVTLACRLRLRGVKLLIRKWLPNRPHFRGRWREHWRLLVNGFARLVHGRPFKNPSLSRANTSELYYFKLYYYVNRYSQFAARYSLNPVRGSPCRRRALARTRSISAA